MTTVMRPKKEKAGKIIVARSLAKAEQAKKKGGLDDGYRL
jgi:hypothetical protein